jgi:hypothetical protein
MYALIVSRTNQIDLKKCLKKFKHSTAAPEAGTNLSNFKLVLCASKNSFCPNSVSVNLNIPFQQLLVQLILGTRF